MNLIRILLELFVLYLVYKLIFDFIIPIFQTTKQMKQQMGKMQEQVRQQQEQAKQQNFQSNDKEPAPKKEDYIEFEEIR